MVRDTTISTFLSKSESSILTVNINRLKKTMLENLTDALKQALEFWDIDPDSIERIDYTVGLIWLKVGQQTYLIDIKKTEFDLDEYVKQ